MLLQRQRHVVALEDVVAGVVAGGKLAPAVVAGAEDVALALAEDGVVGHVLPVVAGTVLGAAVGIVVAHGHSTLRDGYVAALHVEGHGDVVPVVVGQIVVDLDRGCRHLVAAAYRHGAVVACVCPVVIVAQRLGIVAIDDEDALGGIRAALVVHRDVGVARDARVGAQLELAVEVYIASRVGVAVYRGKLAPVAVLLVADHGVVGHIERHAREAVEW